MDNRTWITFELNLLICREYISNRKDGITKCPVESLIIQSDTKDHSRKSTIFAERQEIKIRHSTIAPQPFEIQQY